MKPKVVISRCIEFESCRWNGLSIASPIVKSLKPFIDFIPVCAEVEIGLGVPRDPIRLVEKEGKICLADSATGEEHTVKMEDFTSRFLADLPLVHGFILKSRSPSCGLNNVKVYSPKGNVLSGKGVGLFAQQVLSYSPLTAVEDESRLLNLRIREHFLTKLYTLCTLSHTEKTMKALVDFHSRNKYLFMAYDQQKLKEAGAVIANHRKLDAEKVYDEYAMIVAGILASMPRNSSNINVLQHLFGYFSKEHLNEREKTLFLELLERYRNFQVPLITLTSIIQVWIAKYDTAYLQDQTFLQPFPQELQTVFDTSKGRIEKNL